VVLRSRTTFWHPTRQRWLQSPAVFRHMSAAGLLAASIPFGSRSYFVNTQSGLRRRARFIARRNTQNTTKSALFSCRISLDGKQDQTHTQKNGTQLKFASWVCLQLRSGPPCVPHLVYRQLCEHRYMRPDCDVWQSFQTQSCCKSDVTCCAN
jgi:hypothetical protein